MIIGAAPLEKPPLQEGGLKCTCTKKKKKKNGRIRLSIVESYREPGVKYPRRRTIELLGFLDELERNMMILSRFSKQKLPKERLQKKQAAKEGSRVQYLYR